MRNSILALHSEVYGARLAAKYLDKELAGRMQQLQLLGKEMRTDVRDKLWRQLESEILLHRHKTVIRACRNRTNHEFIPTDSRILNFNYSDEKYLKNANIFRREDSLLKFEGGTNRRKEYDTTKKTESDSKHQLVESLNRNSKIHNSANNNNTNNTNNNKTNSNNVDNENNNITINKTNSDYVIEAKNGQNVYNYDKENMEKIENVDGNIKQLNDPALNNKMKTVEVYIRDKNEVESPENEIKKRERKTDEERHERKESKEMKGKKKKSVSSDGEDFLCVVGEKRTVVVKRQSGQGLGISITVSKSNRLGVILPPKFVHNSFNS